MFTIFGHVMRNRKGVNRISFLNRGYAFKGLLAVLLVTNVHPALNKDKQPIRLYFSNQYKNSKKTVVFNGLCPLFLCICCLFIAAGYVTDV